MIGGTDPFTANLRTKVLEMTDNNNNNNNNNNNIY